VTEGVVEPEEAMGDEGRAAEVVDHRLKTVSV
jgi:hypothetical protein